MKKSFLFICIMFLLSGCGATMDHAKDGGQSNDSASEIMEKTTIKDKDFYLIKTEEDLKAIGKTYSLSDNYMLDNDLTLTQEWEPIGSESEPFTGVFDGNGYFIYHLTVTKTTEKTGFFAATQAATIKDLNLKNVQIDSQLTFPLMGVSKDTDIINCSVEQGKDG